MGDFGHVKLVPKGSVEGIFMFQIVYNMIKKRATSIDFIQVFSFHTNFKYNAFKNHFFSSRHIVEASLVSFSLNVIESH